MQIELSSADANYIKEAVRNGYFPSEEEAVTTAIRMMRQEAEAKQQRLRDALQLGQDDIKAGRYSEYTPELFEEIKLNAKNHAREGRIPKSDVIPQT
jgi:antitoxin ParD1/3/4